MKADGLDKHNRGLLGLWSRSPGIQFPVQLALYIKAHNLSELETSLLPPGLTPDLLSPWPNIKIPPMETKSIKEAHTANVYEPATSVGSAEVYIDPVKERRMMRKFDVRWHHMHMCASRLKCLHC
jgi:hypothetical protein